MVIAFFVFVESVTRLVDPPNINTDMLTVSEGYTEVKATHEIFDLDPKVRLLLVLFHVTLPFFQSQFEFDFKISGLKELGVICSP